MLKNDIRYVIKKILIGIGICIGLFYFKSCNVHALNDQWYSLSESLNNPSGQALSNGQVLTYVIDGKSYIFKNTNGSIYLNDTFVTNWTTNPGYVIGKDSNNNVVVYFGISRNGYQARVYSVNPVTGNPNFTEFPITINNIGNGSDNALRFVYNNGTLISNSYVNCPNHVYSHLNLQSYSCFYNENFYVYGTSNLQFSYGSYNNVNSKHYYSNYGSPVIVPPSISTISTLTPTPILTDDDSVLLGYSFKFVFDNFDTSNFVYKYRLGNGPTLVLSQNNFQISIRENKTLYVWVEDLEGEVIDNESFTISNIGSLYNGSYSIDIAYNDIAPYDTQNTGGSKIINRVDLFLKYLPKTNYLKYQYQYVVNGNSLDSNSWVTLNDNNTSVNEYTLPVHDNGTLYARILDSNDNVVDSTTFNVDSIGKLKLYSNSNNVTNIFTRLKDNIDYGGPISSLILIPVNFMQVIFDSSSGVCTPYDFGSLFGTHIVFNCVDLEDYLGSTLWHLIDIFASFGVIIGISRFLKKIYNDMTTLKNSDDEIM